MAKSTLTTINQIMSIASKAHYLNGGNASKVLAKDKKGIFTIEQVAETLDVNADELKTLLQNNKIMCGDYVIDESWGDGEKLSTFALRTLNDSLTKDETKSSVPMWIYVVFVGALCGVFNLFGMWVLGLFLGIVLCVISANSDNKTPQEYQDDAKKMNNELPENHKAKGMM